MVKIQPPLSNKTVLVTRPVDQALELQKPLEALGARVLIQPATQILPSSNPEGLDSALRDLEAGRGDWLLFSSANGVRFTLERLCQLFELEPEMCGAFLRRRKLRTGVVGSGTAKALNRFNVAPDVVPEKFDAEGLIAALDKVVMDYASQRFVSFRASRGRVVLDQALRSRGSQLRTVEAYQSVDVTEPYPATLRALQSGEIDAAVVTSSASAKALVAMFREDVRKTRWIALSALTAGAMEQMNVKVERVAKEATMTSLVDAVRDTLTEQS
ncbi:MAG: uroporphyrinogen-III synthase [Thermoguttaceae bacterium]|nr:uroporphyrinogen-III synthase [Thermoguttaceae bacterium]